MRARELRDIISQKRDGNRCGARQDRDERGDTQW
jgi:hypothetical protein